MNVKTAYKIYTALRLHFTTDSSNYDIRKGIIPKTPKNGIQEKFQKRLGMLIDRYNSDEQLVNYFVSNFLSGDAWGGLFNDDGHNVYLEWQRKQDSLKYNFEQEVEVISKYIPELDMLWDVSDSHPPILRAYFGKVCSLETLVILNKLYRFRTKLDEKLNTDPTWNSTSILIKKYSPFLKVEKEKFLMITNRLFHEQV